MSAQDSEVILQELLNQEMNAEEEAYQARNNAVAAPSSIIDKDEDKDKKKDNGTHTQWALGGNGQYMPVGSTAAKLPAGIFEPFANPGSWGVQLLSVASDTIYTLPDMATATVLKEVHKFWTSEENYRRHNLLYKRGLMLWGPPGGGKTVTVKLLMNELVKQDGIVIMATNIPLAVMCLKAIRKIEPKRNLIIVMEDIDEIINFNGEANVLSLLDGENNVDNVLNLATTNYPERLGARIINRPSRFDRRIYVGMPEEAARREYLRLTTNEGISEGDLEKWVKDTDKLSIAHLRELVAAVYCLDQPYEEVLQRLKDMAEAPKGESGFRGSSMGFGAKATRQYKD
jgi:hypothetical protein